ncbi:PH domain-containing protein [Halomarina oriensis]|uniref:PH domain-containing protein n=1 Tax=Halomarina oriensis TaxID=671145 RepID=A0A6B0GQW5_9EURY|nr:PH domain-containing protein [Halomarina oriensis]MWG34058.1 PH domain-containing protein [Halomarina oriensis]
MSVPEWVTLGEGEEVVWSGTPSLLVAVRSLLVGALLVVAGIVVYGFLLTPEFEFRWVAWLLIPLGMLVVAVAYVHHRSTRYVITTNEVYRKEGLLSRQVTSLRLDRIQNTSFEQSLLERLLSFGDVRVDTAGTGGTEITFEAVSDPQEVSGLLTEQLDRPPR